MSYKKNNKSNQIFRSLSYVSLIPRNQRNVDTFHFFTGMEPLSGGTLVNHPLQSPDQDDDHTALPQAG